jgi:ABC-2 type transport system ATP-binding protein
MTLSIDVDDLRVRYGDVIALDRLSFSLEGGKIYGLLGRNGSGKTTLLSVLAAFRRASAGTVRIGGQPVFENPAVTSQVCLIRESGDTGEASDRVRDALDISKYLRPLWDADYAQALLDRFQISRKARLGELSRGQQSALGITIGLASRAPVTLFDESHLGMDAPSRQAFQDELLSDFMDHPRTVVISTHLIEELGSLFEELLIIDGGRLVLHDETDALRARSAAVSGPAEAVDRFVAGLTVLGERRLGRTKSAMVYGALDEVHRRQAVAAGLDLGPVALADLFTHLTQPTGESR